MVPDDAPLSDGSMTLIAERLFAPVASCDCSTVLFVPGGGKRTLLEYLLSHREYIDRAMGDSARRTLFVPVRFDGLSEFTCDAYLTLMAAGLAAEGKRQGIRLPAFASGNTGADRLAAPIAAAIRAGYTVAFILTDFERLSKLPTSIYLNLEQVMSLDKSHVTYLFLASADIVDETTASAFDNLKYAITQHVSYWPLLPPEDAGRAVGRVAAGLGWTDVPESLRRSLDDQCGGHPQLLKYALHLLKTHAGTDTDTFLSSEKQIRLICADIWNALTPAAQSVVQSVVRTGTVPGCFSAEAEYPLNTGIIAGNGQGGYRLFGRLFAAYVSEKIPRERIRTEGPTGTLYLGAKDLSATFTVQEEGLLRFFLAHANQLVSRDSVADVLWGDRVVEKYSDWTIDKTVSNLRRKMAEIGAVEQKLLTVKKRGFFLSD
jgi:hypothetical protein